jgi:hypothetical protein
MKALENAFVIFFCLALWQIYQNTCLKNQLLKYYLLSNIFLKAGNRLLFSYCVDLPQYISQHSPHPFSRPLALTESLAQ